MKHKCPTVDARPVTMGELRLFVFRRDRICLGWTFDPTHVCTDKWARPHPPDRIWVMTLEHVPRVHDHIEGRRDNERHCVTLCHGLNVGGPPAELREWMRDRLRAMYPVCEPEQETT